jgi:hypothetical protein
VFALRSAIILLLIALSVVMTGAACGGSGTPESSTPATTAPAGTPGTSAAPAVSRSLYGAPAPSDSKRREIDDLSRDLQNVSQRVASGVPEFASDLESIVPNPPEKPQLDVFGRSIVGAVQGRSFEPAKARELAELLYAALYSRELRAEDRARIKKEISASLTEAGAPADRVAAVEQAFDRLAS